MFKGSCNKVLRFNFLLVFLFGALLANAQCKHFSKKKCSNELNELLIANRYVIDNIFEGETVNIHIPFYGEQEYTIDLCSHSDISEQAYFKVFTDDDVEVHTSQPGSAKTWTFELESFQVLRVEIIVEDRSVEANDIPMSGCAALLVGISHLKEEATVQE